MESAGRDLVDLERETGRTRRRRRLTSWLLAGAWFITLVATADTTLSSISPSRGAPDDLFRHLVLAGIGLVGIAVAHVAVSRRLEAQVAVARELAHNRARLRLATAGCGTGLWEWEASGNRLRLDETAATHLGLCGEASIPLEALFELMSPEDRPALKDSVDAARSGRSNGFDLEFRVRSPAGSPRWIHARGVVAARGEGLSATHLTGTCIDVTERRSLHERMLLESRLSTLGTVAAGMIHELAGPLAYVTTNLDVVRETLERARGGEPLDTDATLAAVLDAADGARRIGMLVDDARVMSRPGRSLEPVPLQRVLQQAIGIARPLLSARARLEVTGLAAATVHASGDRLAQVFINLLVNAAQAIPESGGPGLVQLRSAVRGDRVVVEVQDSGVGIAPEVLPRIFEPFFTTKPSGVGTGLGLAISRGIVQSVGGSIEVESRVGLGTTFSVVLPIAGCAPALDLATGTS